MSKAIAIICANLSENFNNLSWVRSDDIVIDVGTAALEGSPTTPAWWNPRERTIHLNVEAILGEEPTEPALYDDETRSTMRGMLRHEVAHSRWSTWDLAGIAAKDINLYRIAEMFEEVRIETMLRNVNAGATDDLRMCFRWLLGRMDAENIDSRMRVAYAWALIYGRYLSGIALADEVAPFDEVARTVLGDKTVDQMVDILGAAASLRRDHVVEASMPSYAQAWLDLIDPDGTERIPEGATIMHGEGCGHGHMGGGETGEGEGEGAVNADGTGPGEGGGEEIDPGRRTGHGYSKSSEIADLAKDAIRQIEEEVRTPREIPVEMAAPSKAGQEVFGAGLAESRSSRYVHSTPPSSRLRQRAHKMAEIFETLTLPSITLTTLPSSIPPGRLRSREMVRKSAEQARGMMSSATPWESKKRRHSHTRPVIVGIMTDVSGSMRWAEQITAEFSWMMATAGTRIGARTASVTFGDKVEAVVSPGEIPREVRVRSANGGHEEFDQAAAALDGVLHLSMANQAAKVLFIFSDGHLVKDNEMERAKIRLEQFARAGTIVVWVEPDSSAWAKLKPSRNGVKIADGTRDPDRILALVEAQLLRAIRQAQRAA